MRAPDRIVIARIADPQPWVRFQVHGEGRHRTLRKIRDLVDVSKLNDDTRDASPEAFAERIPLDGVRHYRTLTIAGWTVAALWYRGRDTATGRMRHER